MKYAIQMLKKERELIVLDLKQGKSKKLELLKDIDKAIGWINLLNDNGVNKASRYELIKLPVIDGYGGFANYRIAIDDETDDLLYWTEHKRQDGSSILLNFEDIILKSKPNN